jgi:DNA-binding transcriptional MerR regulator
MDTQESLSINQIACLAKVSVRTLHYYDEIGLLKPERISGNNYRSYSIQSVLRLQQILFYKELGFELKKIKQILDSPEFDLIRALNAHRQALSQKRDRIDQLLKTIDLTIENLKGNKEMEKQKYFTGFSEEQQAEYEKQAVDLWDPALVKESSRKWKTFSTGQRNELLQAGEKITLDLLSAMPKGVNDPRVQSLIGQWHVHINNFYPCSLEIQLGLGIAYAEHPEFRAFYTKINPDLPDFFCAAIKLYCNERGVIE